MAISLRQSAAADGNDPTATFGSTPLEGSLLIAIATERSGAGAAALSMDNAGWTKELAVDNELANASFRCSMAVWWKVAGASEPTVIDVTTTGGTQARLVVAEFDPDAGETFTLLEEAQATSGANNVLIQPTGTTASTSGDQFIVACLGARSSDPSPDGGSWENSTMEVESGFVGINGRLVHLGGFISTATGTKSDSSSAAPGGRIYAGAAAGILVFSTAAAPAVYQPRESAIDLNL